MERLRVYWPFVLVAGTGIGIVSLVAALGGGVAGISWAGGVVGVAAGIVIGSINARRAKDDHEPRL
jgi:hypothetical protein